MKSNVKSFKDKSPKDRSSSSNLANRKSRKVGTALKAHLTTDKKTPEHFRRYTNLSALIYLLHTKKITLLNPASWDDKNDAHFMSEYKRKLGAETVLAICFAKSTETYHHWRVFSNGPDGVCIEFHKDSLLSTFKGNANVRVGNIKYMLIDTLREKGAISIKKLPFLKRKPYKDEREYRVIYVDSKASYQTKDFSIDLSCIKRITLSPWMAPAFRNSVVKTLKSIEQCGNLEIVRSTLTGNSEWRALTSLIDSNAAKA